MNLACPWKPVSTTNVLLADLIVMLLVMQLLAMLLDMLLVFSMQPQPAWFTESPASTAILVNSDALKRYWLRNGKSQLIN